MVLSGNIPVIPTPFVDGELHLTDFDRLIERTADYVEGYIVCGSTGEAPSLSGKERMRVTAYVKAKVPQGKEVVVGLGHTRWMEAVEIGLAAAQEGVTTALLPSPYYFPNSISMVEEYVGKIAEMTGLDIVFYDNPATTGTYFAAEELMRLARAVPSIKAVKMTDHSFGKIRTLKEQTNLRVFCGDDIICFRALEAGVDGNMIIAPIVYPEPFRDCWEAFRAGDSRRSFNIYCKVILPFISMFGPGDEIPTTKALLQYLNIFTSAETRLPLLPATEERVREVLLGYEEGLREGNVYETALR